MQTRFTPEQLAEPRIAEANGILRSCVHCGFCIATCPTYVTLGNELDSPRGRIYLIKEMLENDRPADAGAVKHIDRCLSCLACMTTCPSSVNYMRLVDTARAHIEKTWRRPLPDRLSRTLLALVLPFPWRFRLSLRLARLARPLAPLLRAIPGLEPFGAMLDLAPRRIPSRAGRLRPGVHAPPGKARGRVAILAGCAQQVLEPQTNAAAARLLGRLGIEVVAPRGEGCCGALVHHLGRERDAMAAARRNVDVWTREIERGGLDAILITASGCGTAVKDYAHLLGGEPGYAEKAAAVSALARDICEYLVTLPLPEPAVRPGLAVACHTACSLQHGQRIARPPKDLLRAAGFEVREPAEAHLCCGSAGTYNILQSDIAAELRRRKVRNIEATGADLAAAGNVGCIAQIAYGTDLPVIHTVRLLDWAYGGSKPEELKGPARKARRRFHAAAAMRSTIV